MEVGDVMAAFLDLAAAFTPACTFGPAYSQFGGLQLEVNGLRVDTETGDIVGGSVDPSPLLAPATVVLAAAIDYAAERLNVDRDVVIFDLRHRLLAGEVQ